MEDSFRRKRELIFGLRERRERERGERRRREAGDISTTCPGCGVQTPRSELARGLYVCPQCGYHHPIGAYLRLSMVLDAHSFRELDERLTSPNILSFPGTAKSWPRCGRPPG